MKDFLKDYKRYKDELGNIFYEPSIIVVFIFRLRQCFYRKKIVCVLFFPLVIFLELSYLFFTLLFGIHLPKSCKIGSGLMIHHFGGIILNSNTVIGTNCTIRHNVTIGNRNEIDDVPVIGNNVNIGCGAVIIGKIKIGNNVDVGANAVVLKDVPDYHIAVGVPAKILAKNDKHK